MKIHPQTYLYLSPLGKYLKSLQVKYVRIYFDRNHIKPLAEKNFILAGDTLVRLKVQLVVEFFHLSFVSGSQPDTKNLPKHLSGSI